MRVRMNLSISGTRDGKRWPEKGEVVDLPDTEAHALIAMGGAEEVNEFPAEVEAAVPDNSKEEKAVVQTKPARKPRSPRKNS